MFKKAILAVTAVVTLAGASVGLSAPAEAHFYPHYWGHNWGHYGYWNHPHFFVGSYFGPTGNCYWTREPVKVWTGDGFIWEHRHVRVCN